MNDETIIRINKIMKWTLIIGFIMIALLSYKYGFTNCSKCSAWEYEGEDISLKEVWEIYMDNCLKEFTTKEGTYDLNFSNIGR